MIRVGFLQRYLGDGWWGNLTYLQNLFAAIKSQPNPQIQPVLFLSALVPQRIIEQFPGTEVVTTELLNGDRIAQAAAEGEAGLAALERGIEALLASHGVVLTSHSDVVAARESIPNIYWIPDFQNERLPDLFSPAQATERRTLFERQSRLASKVVVSSYDARNDVERYLPAILPKVEVLRFVSGLGAQIEREPEAVLRERYGIGGAYFFMPNQYWVHKNHALVVRALGKLKRQGVALTVVSTGAPKDYRDPGSFQKVMDAVKEEGVEENYKVLGMIPYADLTSLMYYAVAVVNPSKFEGWSTSVEESKAMGKAIALSRIPVHVEQDPARGRFFSDDSVGELADCLLALSDAYDRDADEEQMRVARERNLVAFREFGALYERIAIDTLHSRAVA